MAVAVSHLKTLIYIYLSIDDNRVSSPQPVIKQVNRMIYVLDCPIVQCSWISVKFIMYLTITANFVCFSTVCNY